MLSVAGPVDVDANGVHGELAISLERTAHGRERGRVAQAQRGEALAERRNRDEARVGDWLGHAPNPSRPTTNALAPT